jgi:hypothetical protein
VTARSGARYSFPGREFDARTNLYDEQRAAPQLEPVNALAFEKDGVFEIHTGNQWQSLILPVLAQALRLPQERIVMRTYSIGGGFGRRLLAGAA